MLVVSSGAIALGRAVLKLPAGALKLEEAQAAAAVGQIALARAWSEVLGAHGITAGQVLLTLGDTEERRRYLNARATIDKLLEWRSVPVINENDTVATSEIRYGDNDRLAARVATMMSADLLVLLSDVDGLYDKPPGEAGRQAHRRWSRASRRRSRPWRGRAPRRPRAAACVTKIEAGKIATTAGTHMVIASGRVDHPLAGHRGRRALHLVPHAGQSGDRAQEMDRRLARAARRADRRCRRGARAALGQEPAAGGRDQGRGRLSGAATPSWCAGRTGTSSAAG